ncbi:MAG TPA: outer membrane protein assembly factor BamE [Pinirhizobacter sp.]|uniref:outer membrane protein assembly factor BamE domain-containing protein n=1 Tax=Pinirhizobacter sp. TaxID=2950432 RepID=UPI002C5E6FDC|nr:outer membrane protein assembly factor BamE [Pinirhizobacter sp.]HMH67904.1 outer membrane protein assembly factor BamE [Pinirhizobacter sp.]
MQKLLRTLGMAIFASSVAACGLVYVPDVQQGNLLDKKTVEQLQPGMTKRQVLVLMGSPSVNSPFYQNRWDYVSTVAHRGGPMKVRTFSLAFNNDVLVARLDLKFAGIRQSFTTRNTPERPHRLTMHFVEGPFTSLEGLFEFTALGEHGCKVELLLDFEYAGIGSSVLKMGFQALATRMVDDFSAEAGRTYG